MGRITGFGRGWQEEKASNLVARTFQIMREPASTRSYVYAAIFWGMAAAVFVSIFLD